MTKTIKFSLSFLIISLPPPILILLTNCSNFTVSSNITTLNPIDISTNFNFKTGGDLVNTFYKNKETKENFINELNKDTILGLLDDYKIGDYSYRDEIKVNIDNVHKLFTLEPEEWSVHYIKTSKTDEIYYSTYFMDLAEKPIDGTRMMIDFTGNGEPGAPAYPTIEDMAHGLSQNGFFPNQLVIPTVGEQDNIWVNDFIYKVKIVPKNGNSIFYANSFIVNFIKNGVTLSEIVTQKDLGTVMTGEAGKDLTLEQIKTQLKEFNPTMDDEVINNLKIISQTKAQGTAAITKTVKLKIENLDWVIDGSEVECKVLSVHEDQMYVKFGRNDDIKFYISGIQYTFNPVIDENGWRKCANMNFSGGTSTTFNYVGMSGTVYRKLNVEWSLANTPITGFAGYENFLKKLTIMRFGAEETGARDAVLDLHLLVAPNLTYINTHSSRFGKYIFPNINKFDAKLFSVTNSSPYLVYAAGSEVITGDNYIGFAPNYIASEDNNNLCTDISFYMFTDITLKFKQIWYNETSHAPYRWKTDGVNIHLPFGSKTKITDIPVDAGATQGQAYYGEKVQWNYIYDLN